MTDAVRPNTSARILIVFLSLALVTMLCLALAERFLHPDLTVQREQQLAPMPSVEDKKSMEIGALMRQAAAEPQNIDVLIRLVEQLTAAQSWDAAATFAQRAVAMDATNPKPLYLLGIILHNQGRHKEAAEALEHVLSLKDEASVRYSLGVLYLYFLNDRARGLEHLQAGIEDTEAGRDIKLAIRAELDKNAEELRPEAAGKKPAGEAAPQRSDRESKKTKKDSMGKN